MDIAAIRTGIKDTLEANLTGLKVYTVATANIVPPCMTVTTGDPFIEYHVANKAGLASVTFELTVMVARQDEKRAQAQIDDYASSGTSATKSVIDAINEDRTLDGTVSDCVIRQASAYFTAEVGNASFGATTLTLTAYVTRT